MADIFGNIDTVGGRGFQDGEDSVLVIGEGISLIQNWRVQYAQTVTPIMECGSPKVYFASKHASGTLEVGRIVSEEPDGLITQFGTVCDPKTGTLTAASACNGRSFVSVKLRNLVASTIGFSGQANNSFVQESVGAMFASMGS